MKVGDLVKIRMKSTGHGFYEEEDTQKIAMIIDGPNEVGNIKLLLSTGDVAWRHSAEVEYFPRDKRYLHD
jgi:hypothetical protein